MLGPLLDDLAVSTGSAGASAHAGRSHVLAALGVPDALARASIRFGLGRWTTAATIDRAIERIATTVAELRSAEAVCDR
jgi:cysteine desulfurase